MLIYNVTVKVDKAVAAAWLQWMFAEHLPGVMRTGCFTGHRVVRLLEVDDSEGPTYAFQYQAESKADYNRYIELHAPELRRRSVDKWGDGLISFESVMEVVRNIEQTNKE